MCLGDNQLDDEQREDNVVRGDKVRAYEKNRCMYNFYFMRCDGKSEEEKERERRNEKNGIFVDELCWLAHNYVSSSSRL